MNNQMRRGRDRVPVRQPQAVLPASRLIKEVASHGKRLPELVPEMVMNRLRVKLQID